MFIKGSLVGVDEEKYKLNIEYKYFLVSEVIDESSVLCYPIVNDRGPDIVVIRKLGIDVSKQFVINIKYLREIGFDYDMAREVYKILISNKINKKIKKNKMPKTKKSKTKKVNVNKSSKPRKTPELTGRIIRGGVIDKTVKKDKPFSDRFIAPPGSGIQRKPKYSRYMWDKVVKEIKWGRK